MKNAKIVDVDIDLVRNKRIWTEFDNKMRLEVSLYLLRNEWLIGQEGIDLVNSIIYTPPGISMLEKEKLMKIAVEFNRRFSKERDERMEREAERKGEMEELIAHRLKMDFLKGISQ